MSLRQVCIVLLSLFVVLAPVWLPIPAWAQDVILEKGTNWLLDGIAFLLNILVATFAYLLYLAGIILEHTLRFTIYTPYNNIEGINAGWTLLRDLINLIFIFLLLYVAIATILKADNTTWRKQVVQIIVAAILINFSLFITRVVVDAGNILAIQFYEQITTCAEGAANCEDGEEQDIVDSFMAGMGLQKSFGANAFGEDLTGGDATGNSIKNSLLRLALILVATFAFFTAAILFLARTVAIVFLLVLSPIGIAGANIPMLSKYAQEWRQTLFAQTFVPAVFLFFVFLILALIGEGGYFARPDEEAGLAMANPDTGGELGASYFFNFIIIVAFIIAAVNITKKLSGQVGKMMDGAVKAVAGVGIGVATGGAALAARGTIGVAASRALDNDALKAKAAQGNRMARMQLKTADALSKSSFDARNTGAMKFASKQTGVKFGKAGGKGGYQKSIEEKEKRETKFAESLGSDKAAIDAYDNQIKQRNREVEEHQKVVSALQDRKDAGESLRKGELDRMKESKRQIRKLKEEAKNLGEKKDAKAVERQVQYAALLEKKDTPWKRFQRNTFRSTEMDRRNDKAAAAIRKNAGKKSSDKLIDELKATIEGGKKDDGGEPKEES